MKGLSLRGLRRPGNGKKKDNPEQSDALWHLVKFFLLVLTLTLLSRGLARVSEARVEVGHISRQTIVHSLQTTGTIVSPHRWSWSVPGNLLVTELSVAPGEPVQQGAVLVCFDRDALMDTITRTKAQLRKLQIQQETLLESVDVSDYGLTMARNNLTQVEQELNRAEAGKKQAEENRKQSAAALESAQRELEDLKKLPSDQQDTQALLEAEEKLRLAEVAHQQAQLEETAAVTALTSVQHTYANASAQLDEVRETYNDALRQAQRTEEENALSAQLVKLELEALEQTLQELEDLLVADCRILAGESGIMETMPLLPGMWTDGTQQISIGTLTEGATVTFQISEEEYRTLPEGGVPVGIRQGDKGEQTTVYGSQAQLSEDGTARFQVPLPSDQWSGRQVEVTAELSRLTSDTCVPLSALHADARGYFVYVLEYRVSLLGSGSVAVRVDVTLQDMDGQYAAVVGDITNRDEVLISSNKPLSDGDRVQVEP